MDSAHLQAEEKEPTPGVAAAGFGSDTDIGFRMLVDAIEDYAIFMLSPDGRIRTWNAGAAKIKGYAADEILGKHFSVFYTAEAVARGWPRYELEEAALHGRFEDEGWRVRKDGSTFWANVVITALRDASGTLKGYVKITRNLNERRRQTEALKQSEERFRLLLEGVEGYAIYMLDAEGMITSWNTGAMQITGYRRDEVVGRHFSMFHPTDDPSSEGPDRVLRIAQAGGRYEEEGWRQRKDASLFWANVTTTAVHDEDGQLRGYVKIMRDMSERKRLEELELANRRMSEFLATLGHELRNPLAPVRNAIGILQKDPDIGSTAARCRDMIDRQITHLSRLVDDLLDIGRITSGKIELRLAPVDMRTIIERGIESSRFHTDAREQRINVDLPAEPLTVKGDMTRLVQVLHNLLHNASKFSPPGTAIAIRATRQSRSALIEVRDQGRGMPEHALEAVFQLFVQEDRDTNPTDSGLGIGLTLCRSLVRMHGGAISASSPGSGLGSTFTVRLPLAEPAPPVRPMSATSRRTSTAKRILVLDDNRDSADSLAMLLEINGHQARSLYTAEAALRMAPSFQPHLVFIDLAMPTMDGFAALRAFKAIPQLARTIFIAMTGYGQEDDRQRTAQAGFDLHLVKPLDVSQLGPIVDGVEPAVPSDAPWNDPDDAGTHNER
ncbi:MAG: hybrid sensor histidine kinase/response regulator [Bordetella sp. SCN 67-23]|nr:PAS domain S-box protein [Burkholderiales bacterium]ODS70412.1 MAG: hybrid sensor histidine kinase/response regulator [Bordetella sp. SCN 67-23]OJW86353.1 MAG: hybrid sensor histidine kinase/response regulator [Burkholderiales bacterium 67-32]